MGRLYIRLRELPGGRSAPIDLYFWPTPNGWKISNALHEFDLPYDLHLIDIGAGQQFAPQFLAISPNNRMPAITDPNGPDGKPVSIFESGAIPQYLARKHGRFCGGTERQRIAVDQWPMWQMGGVGPMAGQAHHFLKYAPAMESPNDLPYAKGRYRGEVARLYRVLETQLSGNRYVAGDFHSIADMAIWPWAPSGRASGKAWTTSRTSPAGSRRSARGRGFGRSGPCGRTCAAIRPRSSPRRICRATGGRQRVCTGAVAGTGRPVAPALV